MLGGAALVFTAAASAVGITAEAAAATLPQHPTPMSAGPGLIVAAALHIKTLVDRENYLDDKHVTHQHSPADEAEESRLYDERMALAQQIMRTRPENATDALIVIMHAVDQLNFGNAINEGEEIIDLCERAIRGACTVLARELKVDLVPFGSENFLPDHLSQHPAGRA